MVMSTTRMPVSGPLTGVSLQFKSGRGECAERAGSPEARDLVAFEAELRENCRAVRARRWRRAVETGAPAPVGPDGERDVALAPALTHHFARDRLCARRRLRRRQHPLRRRVVLLEAGQPILRSAQA